jgi:hypothetical protein
MKLTVITDKQGKVIGSARTGKSDDGKIEFGVIPLPGQKHYEVDVPDQIKVEAPAELHKALAKLIKKSRIRTRQ